MAQPRLTPVKVLEKDEELADEAVEHGQADHGQRGDDKEGGGARAAWRRVRRSSRSGWWRSGVSSTPRSTKERAFDDALAEHVIDRASRSR